MFNRILKHIILPHHYIKPFSILPRHYIKPFSTPSIVNWLNKTPWKNKVNIIKDYGPSLLIYFNELTTESMACSIIQNKEFAKGFLIYILNNDKIKLFSDVVNEHSSVIGELYEVSDYLSDSLSVYIFDNMAHELINNNLINTSISCSSLFRELIVRRIIKGDISLLKIFDYFHLRILVNKLPLKSQQLFLNFILDNRNSISKLLLFNICECDILTYNEKLTSHIIDEKNYEMMKDISHWTHLLKNTSIKEKLGNFILNNINEVFFASPHLLTHFSEEHNFAKKLIDKIIGDNIILLNAPHNLYFYFSKLNWFYNYKLEHHYYKHADNLGFYDTHSLKCFFSSRFLKRLEEKLIKINNVQGLEGIKKKYEDFFNN